VLGEDPGELAGRTSFSDLFGRFLIAVHDPQRHRLTICNDRYGLIPLYWVSTGDRLYLSTGIRPRLQRRIVSGQSDATALAESLALHMPLGTRTLLSDVHCLEPGIEFSIDLDTLAVSHDQQWRPQELLCGPRLPFSELASQLLSAFLEANRRCTEDADHVALTLSGGMDTRCLLAAALRLGRPVTAYHVGIPGSRAERYARGIAEACEVPLRSFALDADFGRQYYDLLRRIVETTEGMKLVPQPEMLWLRDLIEAPAVVLHGAFGELAKLRVLRDFYLDDATLGMDRGALPDMLWRRFEPGFRSNLRVFSKEFRASLTESPRLALREKLEAFDADLPVPEVLQLCYFDEFVKSASYGHLIWNKRLPTRVPFLDPHFVDLLLRVRTEDRMEQRFQWHFLQQIRPELYALPDENTGTRAGASRLWSHLIRLADRVRVGLLDSSVTSHHGDLLVRIHHMKPTAEEIVSGNDDPIYDRESLLQMVTRVRKACTGSAPRRGLWLRQARRDAVALQTFFMLDLRQRFLSELDAA
jgi:asparagine synthase (glutamine-hydrolysing)